MNGHCTQKRDLTAETSVWRPATLFFRSSPWASLALSSSFSCSTCHDIVMLLSIYYLSTSSQPVSVLTESDKELNRRINAGHSFSLPFFNKPSQKFNVCVISYRLPDKNLIIKQKIHSYGYVYICQVCGTYPKGFETAVHKEIMTTKRTYFSLWEIILIVKLQPQITYTIQL